MSVTKVTYRSDTAAGDDANIGFTAAEGLILTGQGSTNDVTIKNDADGDVITIATGGTTTTFAGDVTMIGTTPTLTIGDAGAEDTAIVFDGNAQDFHIGLDDTADDLVIGLGSALGTTTHMAFDETGAVTKPLQPCVLLTIPSKLVNQGGSDTQTDIAWGTEIFDIGADFATPSFTAPVTGKYFMSAQVGLSQCDTNATFYQLYAVASNRTHYMGTIAPNYLFSSDASHMITATQIIDMDASDTLKIQLSQNDGASQTDIETSSYFSICLIA